jgi:hypothetical protein
MARGREDISQSDAMQHLRAKAIEDREADIGTVLGRIDVHAEWPLAEGRADSSASELPPANSQRAGCRLPTRFARPSYALAVLPN